MYPGNATSTGASSQPTNQPLDVQLDAPLMPSTPSVGWMEVTDRQYTRRLELGECSDSEVDFLLKPHQPPPKYGDREPRDRQLKTVTISEKRSCDLPSVPSAPVDEKFEMPRLTPFDDERYQQPQVRPASTLLMPTMPTPISVSDIGNILKPFTGQQNVDKWLQSFELYTSFKRMLSTDKLGLLQVMLTEQAADWLAALPRSSKLQYDILVTALKKRYGLSEAEQWKAEKDLWGRMQGSSESVDEYVTTMQLMANKVSMPAETLKKAIIQGLKPELRLFVLNAKAKDIQELLVVARTCEAARSADGNQKTNIDTLTDMVGSLLSKVSDLTTQKEQSAKRVQFVETAMSSRESTPQYEQSSPHDKQRQYRHTQQMKNSSQNQYDGGQRTSYQRTRPQFATRTGYQPQSSQWPQQPAE